MPLWGLLKIELGKPAEEAENRLGAMRSKAAQEVTPAELCHIVFMPASKGQGGISPTSHSHRLVATKAPSLHVPAPLEPQSRPPPSADLHRLDLI